MIRVCCSSKGNINFGRNYNKKNVENQGNRSGPRYTTKKETSADQKFKFQYRRRRKIGHKANRFENVGLLTHNETLAAISNQNKLN